MAAFFLSFPSLGSRTLLLISGCVNTRSVLLRPVPVLSFWRQRISRLYFPYLAILAIYLVISVSYPSKSKIPTDAVDAIQLIGANALMVQGLTSYKSIIVQTCTLAYFLVFYLACPLVVKVCNATRVWETQRIALLVQASIASRYAFGEGSPWTFILIGALSAELLSHTVMLTWLGQSALLGFSLIALKIGETPFTGDTPLRGLCDGLLGASIGSIGHSTWICNTLLPIRGKSIGDEIQQIGLLYACSCPRFC